MARENNKKEKQQKIQKQKNKKKGKFQVCRSISFLLWLKRVQIAIEYVVFLTQQMHYDSHFQCKTAFSVVL